MTLEKRALGATMRVRGTTLSADDSRELHLQKLARITLDSMVQFVGLLDAEGTVLEINQTALEAIGLSLSDVEGKPFWETFWWQISDEVRDNVRDAVRRAGQGESSRWDTELIAHPDGKIIIVVDAVFRPVTDDRGKVVFITAEGRDITDKKAHEVEIARQREELAKLDELKTQFFTNISHEFRTPLTLMLGPVEELLSEPEHVLAVGQRDLLDVAHRNGLRLLRLVNTLLSFSRLEAGRTEALYAPEDLATHTGELASSFRAAVEKAGLRLSVDAPPLSRPVYVDSRMWEQIVLNLLSNAFKFTFEGEIAVTLREVGEQAQLMVRDTGTGIAPDQLPQLFERFHRVEGSRGRTFEGSGIGLALVRDLVKLHGGDISVTSEVDRGSAFLVTVPFGTKHLPADRVAAKSATQDETLTSIFLDEALHWLPETDVPALTPADEQAGEPGLRQQERILVADDNADMLGYVRRLLVGRGYEVETVADGMAALTALRRQRPDLLTTDVMMPQLDGLGLLKAVRADTTLTDVPVIILSARAGDEAGVEGLDAGASDYLTKPFAARELLARVAANLAMARRRREVEDTLRQSQKMEAIGQLTGGVAHDFNNLLTVIRGSADLLQRPDLSPERRTRYITAISDTVDRAAKLTGQLLAFARRQALKPEVFDAVQSMKALGEMLRTLAGSRVGIVFDLPDQPCVVNADPSQFDTAIVNMAVNARDAMKAEGKLTIGVKMVGHVPARRRHAAIQGAFVAVSIADTGCGIRQEQLEQIFEPFFTTKLVGEGTGLGLSQVFGFTKQSGGELMVESVVGRGTTFTLYLPSELEEPEIRESQEPDPLIEGHGSRVLVVEDNADVGTFAVQMLIDLGYDPVLAMNAEEALAELEKDADRFDVVFSDVVMPGMNGIDLAHEIRRRHHDLPVLLASGYSHVLAQNDTYGFELLHKPYSVEQLSRLLRKTTVWQDRTRSLGE